jgi:porin
MALSNGGMYIHKGFAKQKLGIEFGYTMNDIAFFESYIAGNLGAGTLGQDAPIQYEVGQNRSGLNTPTLRLRYQATEHVYSKVGFQRSVDPGGELVERQRNPEGVRFLEKGSKLLTIGELGYRRSPAPGTKSVFVRADGWFNTTEYTDYRTISIPYLASGGTTKKTDNNWAWAVSGDYQFRQPNKYVPFEGTYVGASVQYAPPQQNAYTQYYEIRLFQLGPFKCRPFDMPTFVINHTVFSQIAMQAFQSYAPLRTAYGNAYVDAINPQFGYSYYGDQTTVNAGYSMRVRRGLWFTPAFTYARHPTFAPRLANPIEVKASISWYM